jgi:hypothetical protein
VKASKLTSAFRMFDYCHRGMTYFTSYFVMYFISLSFSCKMECIRARVRECVRECVLCVCERERERQVESALATQPTGIPSVTYYLTSATRYCAFPSHFLSNISCFSRRLVLFIFRGLQPFNGILKYTPDTLHRILFCFFSSFLRVMLNEGPVQPLEEDG